jgi:hypothetical protein
VRWYGLICRYIGGSYTIHCPGNNAREIILHKVVGRRVKPPDEWVDTWFELGEDIEIGGSNTKTGRSKSKTFCT